MRWLSWIVMLPLAAAAIVFSVSNRAVTPVDFWPFGFIVELPVFGIVLASLLLGFVIGGLVASRKNKRPDGGIADSGRFGKDFFHAEVRRKGLSLFDPDGGKQTQYFRILGFGGLLLNDLVQLFIEGEVIGMDSIERLA